MSSITVVDAHPDPDRPHLCHALADAYARGAERSGHRVHRVALAELDFPLLRSRAEWEAGKQNTPLALRSAQQWIASSDHLVFVFPLWMGTMPALLKAFVEQVLRPGVAIDYASGFPKPLFCDKTARLFVTMGMPTFAYRFYYRAHGLKAFRRNILRLVGVRPTRQTLYGMVDQASDSKCQRWLHNAELLGEQAR